MLGHRIAGFQLPFLSALLLLASFGCQADDMHRANQYFENENYVEARQAYLSLARDRHRFAQYRMGLIDYFGLAGDVDKASAYAWFSVASTPFIPILVEIKMLVDDELTHQQRRRGRDLTVEFQEDFGVRLNHSSPPDYGRSQRSRSRRHCTGSRLGKDCGRVDAMGGSAPASPHDHYQSNRSRHMSEQEVEAFQRAYTEFIYEEFNRFDQRAGEQKRSD